jgi:branched-chain amino acid transport system substrate-binding protein
MTYSQLAKRMIAISIVFISFNTAYAGESGITQDEIILGSATALKGPSEGLGQAMTAGLEAAIKDETIRGKRIRLIVENDSYYPRKTMEVTHKLIQQGIFMMVGNVGTPTAMAILPMLKEHNVPAVGFMSGSNALRPGNAGPIVNYRPSLVQESTAVIDAAIAQGLKPTQVCAYVQNDGYGVGGLIGVKHALEQAGAPADTIKILEQIISMPGNAPQRNGIGPVGVYTRNTSEVAPGYNSLKAWEAKSGNACKLVVTAGTYGNVAQFITEARKNGDNWIISTISFTGAENLKEELEKTGATNNVIMTQTVPLLESALPIVAEAKSKLDEKFGFVSLEGYIIGKMMLKILRDMPGELTRENFMKQVQQSKFDLGGVSIDFTKNLHQASDLVIMSILSPNGYRPVDNDLWNNMLNS